MYKKIVGHKTLIFPNLEDLKLVVRDPDFTGNPQEKISSQQAEILTAVYGIIYSNVTIKKTTISLKKFFGKYISSERGNIFSQLNNDIEKRIFGKIMERVIIEFFLNYRMGTTSLASQDIKEGIDFIFKIGNIKIGTDITLIYHKNSLDIKKQKILNQSYLIDNTHKSNQEEVGVGRKVDAVSLTHFYLPNKLQIFIFKGVAEWKNNNYNGHWMDYISETERNKINFHFDNLLKFLQSFFHNILVQQELGNSTFSDGIFDVSVIFDKESHTTEFIIRENGENILEFYLPFTHNLYQKLNREHHIVREYKSKIKKLSPYKLLHTSNEETGGDCLKGEYTHPAIKYSRNHIKNILGLDTLLEDIEQYDQLSTKDKKKIKRL